MIGATPTEAVAALVVLAERRIDLAEVHRAMGRMPEVTRRAEAVCASGNSRECRVFGVTWWQPDGRFAMYEVCLAHRQVEGPFGPLSRQVPLPQEARAEDAPGPHGERVLLLVPQTKAILWALAEGRSPLAKGFEPLNPSADGIAEAGAWLHQLLLTHRPGAVIIASGAGVKESESGNTRLTSIGIEVRTTYIDAPAGGYRDFMRMERIRGVLHGVAYVHCPQHVYSAPVYWAEDVASVGSENSAEYAPYLPGCPQDNGIAETFAVAASAVAELIRGEEPSDEGTSP